MMSFTVPYTELEDAYQWVSADPSGDQGVYISKTTGQAYWQSGDGAFGDEEEADLPDDLDDPDRYWSVPNKHDLDLGNQLVYRFAEDHLTEAQQREVRGIFRKRGAYRVFKNELDRWGQLDAWHAYEAQAVETALREWAEEQGMPLEAPKAAR